MDYSVRNAMQTITGVLQRTSGRDKIARILQYGGMFVAWQLKNNSISSRRFISLIKLKILSDIEWGDRIEGMSKSAGSARKVFRLFGYIEQLRNAGNALSLIDPYKRYLVATAKTFSALYLFCDNMVWAHSVHVLNINADVWKKYEFRFWLIQLTLNIIRDCYEWITLAKREYDRVHSINIGEVVPLEQKSSLTNIIEIITHNPDLAIDTLSNGLDALIPLNRLNYLRFSDGYVGLFGLITSILRLIPIISPAYKLPYS